MEVKEIVKAKAVASWEGALARTLVQETLIWETLVQGTLVQMAVSEETQTI